MTAPDWLVVSFTKQVFSNDRANTFMQGVDIKDLLLQQIGLMQKQSHELKRVSVYEAQVDLSTLPKDR